MALQIKIIYSNAIVDLVVQITQPWLIEGLRNKTFWWRVGFDFDMKTDLAKYLLPIVDCIGGLASGQLMGNTFIAFQQLKFTWQLKSTQVNLSKQLINQRSFGEA